MSEQEVPQPPECSTLEQHARLDALIRHEENLSFALWTVALALEGGLVTLYFGVPKGDFEPLWKLALGVLGMLTTLFVVSEMALHARRATNLRNRAESIEKEKLNIEIYRRYDEYLPEESRQVGGKVAWERHWLRPKVRKCLSRKWTEWICGFVAFLWLLVIVSNGCIVISDSFNWAKSLCSSWFGRNPIQNSQVAAGGTQTTNTVTTNTASGQGATVTNSP